MYVSGNERVTTQTNFIQDCNKGTDFRQYRVSVVPPPSNNIIHT